MLKHIQTEIDRLKKTSALRKLVTQEGLDFSSNDYLGLSRNPSIQDKLASQLSEPISLGSTGSRLISGHSKLYEATEAFIADTFKCEAALIFGSGYLANSGIISALADSETSIFSDELNHASLIDGIRLSGAKREIFKHNDLEHLKALLQSSKQQRKLIVTEAVFSMDGDLAPVDELIELSQDFNALLLLDEAHSTGVFGHQGRGRLKNHPENVITVHTCGKALGGYGAFACLSEMLKIFLINRSRPFIYSTSLPPLLIMQIRFCIEEMVAHPELQSDLHRSMHIFGNLLNRTLTSPIVPILIPGNESVLHASEHLKKNGFFVRGIRSPTVALGQERLRVTIKSTHQPDELRAFAAALTEIL
jgi:8-amino-7-oxononanoate synthase